MAVLLYFQSSRGYVPLILWLALAVALYLTVVEVVPLDRPRRVKAWWITFVLMTHVFGYLILRVYLFVSRRVGPA